MSEPTTSSTPTFGFDPTRAKHAYRLSIGSAILFTFILVFSFFVNRSVTTEPSTSLLLGICILASIISARLSRQGRSTQGVLIMIGSLLLLTATRVFITKGLALSSSIINIIVVTSIAVYTLPRKWISRVIPITFVTSAVTILIDQYIQGIPPTANPEIANGISFATGAIFLFILALQFPRLALRAKLIVGFISLTALPIIILGTQTYLSTRSLINLEASSTITNLIQSQIRVTVITSVLLVAIAAVLGLLVANFFTKPIIELTEVAQSISAGDFSKRATIHTRDEIGLLADSINVMADEIQQSLEMLESRVERRTSDLSLANLQNEKRAQSLQIIAEISRTISTEKDQERLLSLITKIVSDRFGFYHVGIFLLDENKINAILRAANSSGGQEMLQRKHSLKVERTSIVGYVTSTGSPRIALDIGTDAVFFNNPSLPETRSEMALPLTTRGTIIGALDVQSKIPNAFTDADVSIVSLLADQIAIAIDNSRLLEAAQTSIEETRAVFNEYLTEAWQKKTEAGVVGYRQTTTGGQVLTNANMPILMTSNNGKGKSLEVPIRVRDQAIGVLNIRPASEEQDWTEEDMSVIEAVAERLGLALENARLFEETSTRASRERLVAEITTKIRGSNDPQEMIKTAMEELKQVLGASKVEILPQKTNLSPDK